MYESNLIFTKEATLTYLRKLELVFSCLQVPPTSYITGRPPYPIRAMLNALVFKNLRGLLNLAELSREIGRYPALAQACGLKSFPSKERFSHFLKHTPSELFQDIKENLIKELLQLGGIKADYLSTDSCPIHSPVKENNLKVSVKDRFNKHNIPRTDKDARLGAYIVYPTNKKRINFFWGYRNHIVNDAESELPLAEITKPASAHEAPILIPQLAYIKDKFGVTPRAVIADAAFDSASIIRYVIEELKAKPVIARDPSRPRSINNPNVRFSPKGIPFCLAGFEMLSRGIFYDKRRNRTRHRYVCPIKSSKKLAQELGWFCPWNHPKFYSNKVGCTATVLVRPDPIRETIDYGSQTFKKLYNLRTSSERIFSRLLVFSMQRSSVRGLQVTSNLCSLAHISVLAVALAAHKSGNKQKALFIKSFFST